MLADRSIACPILVGRAPMVEALQRWLGRVRADEAAPRVALVAGEAGIGKSRLAPRPGDGRLKEASALCRQLL